MSLYIEEVDQECSTLSLPTSNKFLLICVVFMEGLWYFLVLIIKNVYRQFVCQSVLSVCLFSSPRKSSN
jgi:hypothetical protein